MNIRVICVGKIKENYLKDAIAEYSKRLSKYCALTIEEVEEEKISFENDSYRNIAVQKESERILSKIKQKDYVILMDISGKEFTSIDLAEKISDITNSNSQIVFIIGGSYGTSDFLREKANLRLSFSKLTFPHQLFRVMLLEQIYRAYKINNNEKYHK